MELINPQKKFLAVEYARVSTKNEEQAESCDNQIKLCEEYVKNHPEIVVTGQYVDDGISGKSDVRPYYLKLIDRIYEGDIDYILVKDCNRLCRSTEISAHLDRLCKTYKVKIIYVKDGSIYDPCNRQDRMVHAIKAIFDEDYVYQQSEAGQVAHHMKCMKRVLDATDARFGYYWDNKNKCMCINEDEAYYVRLMFEWYVFGGLGVTEIARKLAEMGVYGQRSGKILTANTISSRLADSSYMGLFYINKKGSVLEVGKDAKTKRFTRPKEEWVDVVGPAIISDELFELAQRVREERRHVYDKPSKASSQARFRGTHLFAGKVFCGDCGTQFHFRYSDRAKTIGEYKDCFGKMKKTLDSVCNNTQYNRIREDTLIALCQYSINVFLRNHEKTIDNIVSIIREASKEALNDTTQIEAYQRRLKKLDKELQKNLEAWRDAPDPDMKDDFLKMYQDNKAEKTAIEQALEELRQQQLSFDELEQEIQQIKNKIEAMKQIEKIDRAVVDNFIDRIIIGADGRVTIILKFGTSFDAFIKNQVSLTYDGETGDKEIPFLNLKFVQNLEDLRNGILYYQSGRCSDTA